MSPAVSILLPVFNGEHYLTDCLKSLKNQTFHDFEILVVNNGSTDRTEDIVLNFCDERIKYFKLPEANLVHALNYGLNQAKSPLIARMDADDIAYPNRIIKQYEYLTKHKDIGLVSGLVKYKGDESKNPGYANYINWVNSIRSHEEISLNRYRESSLPHPTVMFRKKLIQQFGPYKHDIPEDFELWNRWLATGVKMAKLDEVVLDWTDHPKRMSRSHHAYKKEKFSKVKAEYFSQWFDDTFGSARPDIYVFGYSPTVKQKVKPLIDRGLKIKSFLDIKRTTSPHTTFYKDIEQIDNKFVLSYVSDREGKTAIERYLKEIGLVNGEGFYMME